MRRTLIILLLPLFFSCSSPLSKIENGISDLAEGQKKIHEELSIMKGDIKKLATNDSIMNQQLQYYPASVPTTGNISSRYQTRVDPIDGQTKMHLGIDIRAPKGTPVISTATGMVESVNYEAGNYGERIIINHMNGYKSIYGHLSKMYVHVGQTVVRGDTIGEVGNTGRTTGSHLHYEISFHDKKINPAIFRQQFKSSMLNVPALYYSQL